jgi:mannose-6-phosphate isomerase-like protein (cupin superfamily)
MAPYCENIEEETLSNLYYRKVLHTTPQQQLVVMTIAPGQEIPWEIHPSTTQLLRIESGEGVAILQGSPICKLQENTLLVIPPSTRHCIINTSRILPLQLYTVYSPPEHPPDTKQRWPPSADVTRH